MRLLGSTSLLVLAFTVSLTAAHGNPTDESPVPTRVDEMETELSATIEAIELDTRDILLRDAEGNTFAFHASEDIERLEEMSVGDRVNVKYKVTMAMELRAPTEEELAEPFVYLDKQLRATTTQPAGVEVQTIRAVTQIVGIDLPSETATLMGPYGNLLVVQAEDPATLATLGIGDSVIVTYREALAIALEKADPPAME